MSYKRLSHSISLTAISISFGKLKKGIYLKKYFSKYSFFMYYVHHFLLIGLCTKPFDKF